MCGRFTLRRPGAELAAHFGLREVPELGPRFNAAPGQQIAAVRADPSAARELAWLRWGLLPGWAGEARAGARLVNARAESAAERPTFAAAFRQRRCLVPADGFFEWSGHGRARRPWHVQRRGGALFAIAALWERWCGPDGERVESCALLTIDAAGPLRELHDRMPALVEPEDYARWLDPALEDTARLRALLRGLPAGALEIRAVGPRVNRPEVDDPGCLEPAPPDPQGALFS